MRKISYLFLIHCFICLNSLQAEEVWSFDAHPHPLQWQLSEADDARLDRAKIFVNGLERCEFELETHYRIYIKHYPEFAENRDLDAWFRPWWLHVAARPASGPEYCANSIPYDRYLDNLRNQPDAYRANLLSADPFWFCGTSSRPARNAFEAKLQLVLSDLLDLSVSHTPEAIRTLLILQEAAAEVKLVPPLEFYLRLAHASEWDEQPDLTGTEYPELDLTDEQRAHVLTQVKQKNIFAVIPKTCG